MADYLVEGVGHGGCCKRCIEGVRGVGGVGGYGRCKRLITWWKV